MGELLGIGDSRVCCLIRQLEPLLAPVRRKSLKKFAERRYLELSHARHQREKRWKHLLVYFCFLDDFCNHFKKVNQRRSLANPDKKDGIHALRRYLKSCLL